MQTRTLAGLGMALLAAGLLIIFFATRDPDAIPDDSPPAAGRSPSTPVLPGSPAEVQLFLDRYNEVYQAAWTVAREAEYAAATDLTPDHAAAALAAERALAEFTGSEAVIDKLRRYRDHPGLTELQARQIETAWRLAARRPAPAADQADEALAITAALGDSVAAFRHVLALPGAAAREVARRELDNLLRSADDLAVRRAVWESTLAPGPELRDGLVRLRELRNDVAREMGYGSHFALSAADYGLGSDELMDLMAGILADIRPLYEQLHCWVRHELAARYGKPVPDLIPAHWLGTRRTGSWPGLVAGGAPAALPPEADARWIVDQAERFCLALGLAPLPADFWARSDLFALPADATRRKLDGAAAWHIDLAQDVRAVMNLGPDLASYRTAHHELGRIHCFLACARPEVPPLLRQGTNRAFPGAIGALIALAAQQPSRLAELGLTGADTAPDLVVRLLDEALAGVVVRLPYACGTVTHWEHEFYAEDLHPGRFNTRWWELAARHQGLAPPVPRGEGHCDPPLLAGVIDAPARAYDQAVGSVIVHQLHRYICREILREDVHTASYAARPAVGLYLDSILRLGATRDWARVMREATGEELSPAALVEYYAPLQTWLEEQNQGRTVGF